MLFENKEREMMELPFYYAFTTDSDTKKRFGDGAFFFTEVELERAYKRWEKKGSPKVRAKKRFLIF